MIKKSIWWNDLTMSLNEMNEELLNNSSIAWIWWKILKSKMIKWSKNQKIGQKRTRSSKLNEKILNYSKILFLRNILRDVNKTCVVLSLVCIASLTSIIATCTVLSHQAQFFTVSSYLNKSHSIKLIVDCFVSLILRKLFQTQLFYLFVKSLCHFVLFLFCEIFDNFENLFLSDFEFSFSTSTSNWLNFDFFTLFKIYQRWKI